MLKNKNLIKKVKVLSYNETNKKFDAQSVIISNIADATEEYDAINFSCLKKYINNNIEYKINDLIESIKEIKKIIYEERTSDKFVVEKSYEDIFKKIQQSIFEYSYKHKDIIDKILYYEKKNEYILKYIESIDNNINNLEKNILDKNIYVDDKNSLKIIFSSLEKKFDEKINNILMKHKDINILYENLQTIIDDFKKSNYTEINNKLKQLENTPDRFKEINNSLSTLFEYKEENNKQILKIIESDKQNKKTIEENFEELNILKNILKELENKILLFDINIIKNKKDIDFLEQKIKSSSNSTNTDSTNVNEDYKNKLHDLDKKVSIVEKLFLEEKQINTKNYFINQEEKKSIKDDIYNIKNNNNDQEEKLKNIKDFLNNEFKTLKTQNEVSIFKLQENFNFLYNENILKINELNQSLNTIKEILNKDEKDLKTNIDFTLQGKINELEKEHKFLNDKIKKHIDINKIDINLLNTIIETLKDDIIKINKIILENNNFIENIKEENKKINEKFNFCSNVKEFTFEIPITISNNNFIIPTNINTFFSFNQKHVSNKFIKSKLLKLYTKIELKNIHNTIIPINTTYNKESIKVKFIKNNKEFLNFEITNLEDSKINLTEEKDINFPFTLSIKPNNLKECINFDYYVKRNNLKTITIKILGVYSNCFE